MPTTITAEQDRRDEIAARPDRLPRPLLLVHGDRITGRGHRPRTPRGWILGCDRLPDDDTGHDEALWAR
jgi:hypothetical protein